MDCLSAAMASKKSQESKKYCITMNYIVECFRVPLAEFLNIKELLPSLRGKSMIGREYSQQLITKINHGTVSHTQACLELFDTLTADVKDQNHVDVQYGKDFVDCLEKGDIPAHQMLAKYIKGTGTIHAYSDEERKFRNWFIENLQELRTDLDRNDPVDALQKVFGHRVAQDILNKGHEGSIDQFLYLVFSLERSPASFKEPLLNHLRQINRNSLIACLSSGELPVKGSDNQVTEEYLQSFSVNFTSLGPELDESGVPFEFLNDGSIRRISLEGSKPEIIEDKDSGEKENTSTTRSNSTTVEGMDNDEVTEKLQILEIRISESSKSDSFGDNTGEAETSYNSLRSYQGTAEDAERSENIPETSPQSASHFGENETVVTSDQREEDATQLVQEDEVLCRSEDDDDAEVPAFYKTLRKYQYELAGPGVEGKNTIIIAPTGTGKTHVAAYIIDKHFKRLKKEGRGRKPKVVFIVHTKVLADQQHSKLDELIGQQMDRRILSATGDKLDCPFAEILRIADVVVLTAQVLLNGLTDGDDKVTIGDISLLIFDECHNCQKGHPFNRIMHEYHEVKRKYVYQKATPQIIAEALPQVIGMTASIGTGKGKSNQKAFEHILEICANLDAEEVQTVLDKENLQKYLNIPEEIDPQIVPPRSSDPFKVALEIIMREIEEKLKNVFEGRIEKGKVGGIAVSCNGQKDSQIYESWIKQFERESVRLTVDNGKMQEIVLSCLFNLLVYSRGLCLNRDVRMKDAITYLKEQFAERRPIKGACNEELVKKFDENLQYLESISKEDTGNPVLIRLKEIIESEFTQKPNSRALLFTPTIQSTKALKEWVDETKEFEDLKLNPSRVTGATELKLVDCKFRHDFNDTETTAERDNTIRNFRRGEHKLLVVTNVVEQGMDVPECNLVIRLNYIPSDTGHIQVKGRNRAKGGKSYLVASSGHGNFRNREIGNKIRENMMSKLLDKLKTTPKEEFKISVQKIQDKSYKLKKREDERKQRAKQVENDSDVEYQLYCFNCKMLACSSQEVITIKTYHTVQSTRFLEKKVERASSLTSKEAEKEPHDDKVVGIIRCKMCKHRWGSWVKFEHLTFPSIHIYNFETRNMDTMEGEVYQKWQDVPFRAREVDDLEMTNKVPANSELGDD